MRSDRSLFRRRFLDFVFIVRILLSVFRQHLGRWRHFAGTLMSHFPLGEALPIPTLTGRVVPRTPATRLIQAR